MAIASSSESTRLAPIGDVTRGTGSDSGTTVSGEESAPNEPTTERSSGGSATGSTLSADGRTGEVTPRRSCSVPTSQYSTTAWTLLSAVTMTTSVEASTSCTSSLVEVPQETVMRGAVGGLRGVAPVSKYRWKFGERTDTEALTTGELTAPGNRS